MRFAFIILSIFAIALSSNLDPYSETEKFLSNAWDHLKAKNYTIIDPEFYAIIDYVRYNKEQFINMYLKNGIFPDKMPKRNVTNAIFDEKGMLVFDTNDQGNMQKNFAKPNANITGGYALFRFDAV
ncbi:unnamed protein product [Caenorhabditis angaria]|uniref:Uncharacterized protein n=1 Tax=Caenorhabditis angaria TaxID=860376 RepID=A0A9P1J5C2_9PELO|nr:unnamed protein product [Caenorhabditis angaria]